VSGMGLEVGDSVTFSKTVGESDVYLFGGITGDLSPNHVDGHFMAKTRYGGRIAHGALLIGYMSTTSTRIVELAHRRGATLLPVSLGYDRIRFLEAVRLGDTIRIDYRIAGIDEERRRSVSDIAMTNQDGTQVAVAQHIMKWLDPA